MRLPSRIGLIGDVHAEHILLQRAVDKLKSRGITQFLCTGDVVDGIPNGGGDIDACCDILRAENIPTVSGNHERWVIRDGKPWNDLTDVDKLRPDTVTWLNDLRTSIKFETPAGGLLLCHGMGDNDMTRFMPDAPDAEMEGDPDVQAVLADNGVSYVINGHSHRRMLRRLKHLTILNVGTLYRTHDACFAELDLANKTVTYFDFVDSDVRQETTLQLP
ncbi:MAG: metallophosphoesterase family protein [Micavibrio sp.]|nr:metallophosphoesterase family protein [Micavibrio sp.]